MAKSLYKDKLQNFKSFFETNIKYPIRNLYLQSVPLKKMVQKAIHRANRKVPQLYLKGNFIPGLMEFENIDKKILLIVKDKKKHLNMIKKNNTHKLRKVSDKYFENIRNIQNELIIRAKKFGWIILDRSN